MYDLTAADILQPALAEGPDAVHSAMRGHLVSADFWDWSPFRMVRRNIDATTVQLAESSIASAGAVEPVTCLAVLQGKLQVCHGKKMC